MNYEDKHFIIQNEKFQAVISYLQSCCSHMLDISSTNLVPSPMHCNMQIQHYSFSLCTSEKVNSTKNRLLILSLGLSYYSCNECIVEDKFYAMQSKMYSWNDIPCFFSIFKQKQTKNKDVVDKSS